jgi:hypothetical protein
MKKFILIISLLTILSVGVISLNSDFFTKSKEVNSPGDWIKEEQIKVFKDNIILNIANARWSKFTDTNSMDPLIDEDSHGIEIIPENPESINIGDIISYKSDLGILIHRVIEKGEDKEGIYYLVKGDNNRIRDPFKVRFNDIQGVLVAIIY